MKLRNSDCLDVDEQTVQNVSAPKLTCVTLCICHLFGLSLFCINSFYDEYTVEEHKTRASKMNQNV